MIPDQDLTNRRADGQEHNMNSLAFSFAGEDLNALSSGALWWPMARLLCVSDLHLGKSERIARRTGTLIPPYEAEDTLSRLQSDLGATGAARMVALGDSFDDMGAAEALSGHSRLGAALQRPRTGRAGRWEVTGRTLEAQRRSPPRTGGGC